MPDILITPLPYVAKLEHRAPDGIDLVVIHCTELPDLTTAKSYGLKIHYPDSGTGNSGHFYIDRNGSIEQWVPVDRVAHHVRGYNERSIGIELVNNGRYPHWLDSRHQHMTEPYPSSQIRGLINLLAALCAEFPGLKWIDGHESLDKTLVPATNHPEILLNRKMDPGPLFPWQALLSATVLKRLSPEI